MNKKIVAIIVPLMMVLSGVVVAVNTVADDDIIGTTTIEGKTNFTVGEAFYLNVNEANYINYDYSSKWSIKDTDGNEHVLISGKYNTSGEYESVGSASASFVSNGVKYTITNEKAIGSYKVATELEDASVLNDSALTWTVSITINGQTKFITLTKTVSPSEPKQLKIDWVDGGPINPVVGTVFNKKIVAKFDETEITSDEGTSLTFYAIGLPEGLSMSSDGHINGVPTASGLTAAKIAVSYTEGGVKKIATGTLEINVVAMGDIKFTMHLANSKETAPGVKINDGSFYIAVESDKDPPMKLTIKPADDKWQANAHVKVVSSLGVVSDESKYDETFDIPVNGTGAYTVIVTYAGVTQSFTLYVLPAGALSADIFISGN